ncbi:enoyl-CoA hydratase/isomerase family protein [Lysobacter oculi]|uniref:Enoyl-CoA hydratase/isomerase family protein n=1 Tax=Solilutibacter oculi TaxID=2698682 RepID=A0A344J5L7_9GAMM|nr:enoyl-CoA hydratase/isomerase family protein [Lysobacter oculi]AXA84327.1 enoyl-CoA hydratase/isomerase family protein [Lysobacter oculi]
MIDSQRHGPHIHLALARAPVNALDPTLCNALVDALARAVDDGAHGIVLSGGARVFSAGLDVPYLMGLGDDASALRAGWEAFFAAARALAECPVPVVAAIEGHAPAGGCVLALCCDHRIMADAPIRIGLNETQVGLAVPESVQHLLRRTVGRRIAERMLLVGAMIEPREALAIHMIDALVPPGETVAAALEWLAALEALPRAPMLTTRAMGRADLVRALSPEHLDIDQPLRDWLHPDTQQGLRALLAKLGKS